MYKRTTAITVSNIVANQIEQKYHNIRSESDAVYE